MEQPRPQPPQQALDYMTPPPAPARVRFGRGVLGWVLFIGLSVMLFFLLSSKQGPYRTLPLSAFVQRLETGQISSIVLDGDEISGTTAAGGGYRTTLPPGMSGNWQFVQWLIETGRGASAVVEVRSQNNLLANIVVPLIPWLLIFSFIWFFVFRQLRKAGKTNQTTAVITGPGRWIPDEPVKAEPT